MHATGSDHPDGSLVPFLDLLEMWVGEHRTHLERCGRLSFGRASAERSKRSAHLAVVLSDEADVELVLWETGEAEFNRGPFAASVFEHVTLETPEELATLLRRFLDIAERAAP